MIFVAPPNLNDSFAISADWLELLCVLRPSGTATESDFTGPVELQDDRAAALEIDPGANEEDPDIVEPAQEGALDALYGELGRRQRDLGNAYPFNVTGMESPRHLRLELAPNITDKTLSAGRQLYRACLLFSALRSGIIDAKAAGIPIDPVGNLFQICATLAAAGFVGGDAYWFGSPRPDHTSLLDALKRLAALLKVGEPVPSHPEGESRYAKDAGIDVVAWRQHTDHGPGKLIIYGQCASGMNWEEKSIDGKVRRLAGYYIERPPQWWLPVFMVPFPLYMGKENACRLRTEDEIIGFYSQREAELGLILDRSLVVLCAMAALKGTQPSAQVARDQLPTVFDWCARTARQVCATP